MIRVLTFCVPFYVSFVTARTLAISTNVSSSPFIYLQDENFIQRIVGIRYDWCKGESFRRKRIAEGILNYWTTITDLTSISVSELWSPKINKYEKSPNNNGAATDLQSVSPVLTNYRMTDHAIFGRSHPPPKAYTCPCSNLHELTTVDDL